MLIHTHCKGTVLVNLTSAFRLFAEVNPDCNNSSLVTTRIHFYQDLSEVESPVFTCLSCNSEVSISEILVQCRRCGDFHLVEESYSPRESGGIYCRDCIERYPDEVHNRLEVIFSRRIVLR